MIEDHRKHSTAAIHLMLTHEERACQVSQALKCSPVRLRPSPLHNAMDRYFNIIHTFKRSDMHASHHLSPPSIRQISENKAKSATQLSHKDHQKAIAKGLSIAGSIVAVSKMGSATEQWKQNPEISFH